MVKAKVRTLTNVKKKATAPKETLEQENKRLKETITKLNDVWRLQIATSIAGHVLVNLPEDSTVDEVTDNIVTLTDILTNKFVDSK